MELDYILTHSGRKVSPASGVPSEEDLALSLSRQPRFGGMARRHWTVIDHSLFAAQLALHDFAGAEVVLALLLHDAHEFTGDIPTHFKTPEQRAMQQGLDARIFASYFAKEGGVYVPFPHEKVAEYDRRSLLAEALLVGPPCITSSDDVELHFGEKPRVRDVVSLDIRLRSHRLGVNPSEILLGLKAGNVMDWLKSVRVLREQINNASAEILDGPSNGVTGNSDDVEMYSNEFAPPGFHGSVLSNGGA